MFLKRLHADSEGDLDTVKTLLDAGADYTLRTFGVFPSSSVQVHVLTDFPESCAPENRLVFGGFERSQARGLIRICRNWPEPHVATIGLLLIDPVYRRKHVGTQMLELASCQARRWTGVTLWRLFVLASNEAGTAFWAHCGFQTIAAGVVRPEFTGPLISMERPIKISEHGLRDARDRAQRMVFSSRVASRGH